MLRKPLVSVIIPVYNVEKYLKDCMDSILHQTYANLDILLVDDGSGDDSGRLCDKYAGLDSRVRVLHKENGGLMSAWLAGVEMARGEYFTFVDSDDWIEPNMVEELVGQLSGTEKEMICSNYIIEKEKVSIPVIQAIKPGVYDRKAIEEQLFLAFLGRENRYIHFSRCMKLISRELITENVKYCNPKLTMAEDLNIIVPAILDAHRIVALEKGLYYHYRFVDASMVHKYNPGLYEKVCLLYSTLKDVLEKKAAANVKENLFRGLKKEYLFLLFLVLKNELRGPARGCRGRIRRIIQEAKAKEGMEELAVEVSGRANRLLYFIWKKPGTFSVLLGRLAIGIFDWIN
ncbi:MAG: glycosyltransferase family 2 protein [Lachnospiraceae bacterium]|nr:glycosyltransferase family 2 protein [Lachnospiraceae bacterium]